MGEISLGHIIPNLDLPAHASRDFKDHRLDRRQVGASPPTETALGGGSDPPNGAIKCLPACWSPKWRGRGELDPHDTNSSHGVSPTNIVYTRYPLNWLDQRIARPGNPATGCRTVMGFARMPRINPALCHSLRTLYGGFSRSLNSIIRYEVRSPHSTITFVSTSK